MMSLGVLNQTYGQETSTWKERISFGGNTLVTISPVFVDISPLIRYKASKRLLIQTGGVFNYLKPKKDDKTRRESTSYGGRFGVQYHPLSWFHLYGEAEGLSVMQQSPSLPKERRWQWNPNLGGGLSLPAGAVQLQVTILYNFNYQPNFSTYPTPWIFRIGVMKR